MAIYTTRSERQLMDQINYNLLFFWFVGFSMNDKICNHSFFTRIRDRLLEGEVVHRFFHDVMRAGVFTKEHFSVDCTLIEAMASLKSYRRGVRMEHRGGRLNPSVDFHGEKRRRETHKSKTGKDAYLFKKSISEQ